MSESSRFGLLAKACPFSEIGEQVRSVHVGVVEVPLLGRGLGGQHLLDSCHALFVPGTSV